MNRHAKAIGVIYPMERVAIDIENAGHLGYWVTGDLLGRQSCNGLERVESYIYGYEYECPQDYSWECDVCPSFAHHDGKDEDPIDISDEFGVEINITNIKIA